ncbi:glycosyltransferase [Butyrivibrio sp. DSM 10294]|uniref:glycosyltransferase family 2 protein n=1 Tax=Butyrivibrio sp. DSM 10294 TaxID=2972457 RepID=UPI00234ECCD5|nr:glycosyltransferase [Butyrivibrio sp. DSM 10294]MDC7294805.1 glycosyltransferase [Butyrivibrio sp. DSM 10294]
MKKISVIIPVYNDESGIRRCIDSVLTQKIVETEILLIDDGSTDNSPQILDEYAASHENIRCIHKQNGGAASARNLGLDEACGDYIFFLDGDDFIEEDALSALLTASDEYDADMVIGNFCTRKNDGTLIKNFTIPEYARNKVISEYDYWRLNAESSTYVTTVVWTRLFKKEVLQGVRFKEGVIHEDEFIQIDFAGRAKRIYVLDKIITSQCMSSDSVMRRPFNIKNLAFVQARRERVDYLIGKGYYDMALYNFGFGSRSLIIAHKKLKDGEAQKEIKRLYREYKALATRLSTCVSTKDKIRLTLFRINLDLYDIVRNALRS